MRAVVIDPEGGGGYRIVERPVPVPGSHEVAIDIRAASLNYRDEIIRSSPFVPQYNSDARGRVALSDGVGVVSAIGEGVTDWAIGDRVIPSFFPDWISGKPEPANLRAHLGGSVDGVLAERIVMPASALARAPSHLTDAEAATLSCAGVTAWVSLVEYGGACAGQSVLVQGTGGVSLFVLQIAKALGLRTIVTSSSNEKLSRARALGADETINYRARPDWDAAVLEITQGRGVDHIVDIGGESTIPISLRALALDGNLSMVGVLTGSGGTIDRRALSMRFLHLHSVFVGSLASLNALIAFMEQHEIRPVIDSVYDMAKSSDALDHLKLSGHFGKIAITV